MSGLLMPIGGAEDKRAARAILKSFVRFSGGSDARIAILPSASSMPQLVARDYVALFTALGAGQVEVVDITDRRCAGQPDTCAPLSDATGIFISGGDQLKLMSLIGSTRLADMLHARYRDGAIVAGTSAGASILSRHMIAFGRSGATPSQRMVQMASGLGLTQNLIIDQHFSQRDRLGRLLTAVALNPGLVGVGIDEDTALLVSPLGECQVLGTGTVTVVDGRQIEYSDVYAAQRHDPFTLRGVDVQVYRAGAAPILLS
ncbi:MAG: cyanophycinase [Chloroflexi bacterium]|nr:cyanophycinase [Chloroflexota bacterium]